MSRPASPSAPELAPARLADLLDAVRSCPRVVPVGAGTKPCPSRVGDVFRRISTRNLQGIVEYEPDEFIITALAGTPIRDIARALAERGQYLPFEPLLSDAGATLGGTLAAAASGPGRFRFGGTRDFVLGVRFIDGLGRHLRVGGKVVKNAAGFDVSKFLVGSLGRYGFLTEATLKVFPAPASRLTLRLDAADLAEAIRKVGELGNSRFEIEALEVGPGDTCPRVRLAGPHEALPRLARDLLRRWPGTEIPAADAERLWTDLREFGWAHANGVLARIPLTPDRAVALNEACRAFPNGRLQIGAGANIAWLSLPADASDQGPPLSESLRRLGLSGLAWRAPEDFPLWLGAPPATDIARAVKTALDPEGRFPA